MADKNGWKIVRGGLHRMYVDGNLVGEVEMGRESGNWYWMAFIHGEPTTGPRVETAELARARVESALETA